MAPNIPFLTLNDGNKMPVIGIGTWQASDEEVETAIDAALEAGYRHIDTAPRYRNEKAIGQVLKRWLDSGRVKREELFIVTKLPLNANAPSDVEPIIRKSLADLQLDYVDMFLIHSPFTLIASEDGGVKKDEQGLMIPDLRTNHAATWVEMEKLVPNGLARSIGISNFDQEQVGRLLKTAKIRPATNQIEHHVYLQQRELVDFCKAEGVAITAYSPLGSKGLAKLNASVGIARDLPDLMDIPVVKEIAAAHGKTPAQVLLRWVIDTGVIAIPKSSSPERLRQNFDIFDFKLTEEEIAKLLKLDQNFRICDMALLRGVERHPEFRFKNEFTQ
ncbi:1,5-anhydro-D-fructose reductase-like [Drosophila nasuta]|uniref:1,5-anhydro-D-fructose reductase-like n=1 Tax=Drosophila nasuta TaxID=42062 RepID=UPI00295E2D9E|nr:1,5-anhydro-D-fructose reductase-like [Drosophila nasuta]XP_060648702.1 1,5-anhydro-D-fructose reductase-like [Drosophila nasuta]